MIWFSLLATANVALVLAAPRSVELLPKLAHNATSESVSTFIERISVRSADRMDTIKSMYAWEGFVYSIEACKSTSEMTKDFSSMKSRGVRTVITFEFCGSGADPDYYESVITAAGLADINIIPLVWTLPIHAVGQNYTANDTFLEKSVPRIDALTQAVIRNPNPVLAVALGDEPLFDNDAGSPSALASYIVQMKSAFTSAGLNIPVSISELAFGWQSSGDISSVQEAVDFFMINNFPYFSFDATSGGSDIAWNDFLKDMEYYETISQGKPLLVTQTGWPSNENEFAPNSPDVVASIASEEAFWNLLDSHCKDYFKTKNIGWMWRSWDNAIDGWGVMDARGKDKWDWQAKSKC